MSEEAVGQEQGTQQTDEQVAREVAEFFASPAIRAYQPRLRAVSGTCRFDIAGAGSWQGHITDGMPTITQDANDQSPADCVVASSARNFVRVLRREGNLNLFAAMLQGLVTVTGDPGFATALLGGITLDTVELTPQSLRREAVR